MNCARNRFDLLEGAATEHNAMVTEPEDGSSGHETGFVGETNAKQDRTSW